MVNILKRKKIDFTDGPLFWNLLSFMIPIVLTSLLQVLYDTADKIVVGQFSGDPNALGAIGSTTFISGLIINFMIGVGAGAGVLVAQAYGAKNESGVSRATHNAFILGAGLAVVMTVIAYSTAAPILRLLDTKEEVFDSALLYINIIYSSILASAIYNIGASVLRAIGDSSTSLTIGMISGLINVVLNVFFVVVCGMSVEGVAIATVISKYYSAATVVIHLYKKKGESYAFDPKKLIAHKPTILRMLRLGIPTGLQSACFSLANLASVAALNSFDGTIYISARSIATDIDHFTSVIAGAFLPAALNATGQNAGAKRPDRIKKIFLYSIIQATVIVGVISNLFKIFAGELSLLFIEANDPFITEKITAVKVWCERLLTLQFLLGVLNAATGVIRGLGYSVLPLIFNLIGTVGSRLAWVYLVFFNLETRTLEDFRTLSAMYPISWGVTAVLIGSLCIVAFMRLEKEIKQNADTQKESDGDLPEESSEDPLAKEGARVAAGKEN